jgi:hypothetical protein
VAIGWIVVAASVSAKLSGRRSRREVLWFQGHIGGTAARIFERIVPPISSCS